MPDLNEIKQEEQGSRDRRGRFEKGRFPQGTRPARVSRRRLPPRHSGEGGHLGAGRRRDHVGEAGTRRATSNGA